VGLLKNGDSIVDIRRALSIGGTAVVAAAVGAACSFAFSGAIALNDAAGVQVSASPVIVPSARTAGTVFRVPQSVDAAGPEIVPAPEPHDLMPPTTRGSESAQPDAPAGAGSSGAAATPGHGGQGVTDPADPDAPGLSGETPVGSEQSRQHSNRDTALENAPGQNKDKRKGSDQSDLNSNRDTVPGLADDSSDPDTPDSGGG